MDINKIVNGTELEIKLVGRLDTTTSPQLETEIKQSITDITKLVYDFTDLEYISSAGLRVLFLSQKLMSKKGEMVIRNANETIKEVFDITGFCNILKIE